MHGITCVVTSCNRHDLLRQTLESFCKYTDLPVDETIIIEDSSAHQPDWLNPQNPALANLGRIKFFRNGVRKGQVYSIDEAYRRVATTYIFHLEDDWEFLQGNFMQRSLELLQQDPHLLQIDLRGQNWGHPLIDFPPHPCKIAEPYWRGGWGGLAWNPGLRRHYDWRRIGSYGQNIGYVPIRGCSNEMKLSKLYLDMGFRIGSLNEVIVTHLGGTRSVCTQSVADIPQPRILVAIPACHAYDYGQWESADSPHFDQQRAYHGVAYGSDIHISGSPSRLDAIRATWWRDLANFPNLTGKLFFGTPHDREALADEVFLSVPDDYQHLPHKTQAICQYALQHGYDYLYKCDDDTAVYVDRLVAELLASYPHPFHYAGYKHGANCTGGPGYWLSRKAMQAVAEAPEPNHWAEDMWVGRLVGEAHIEAEHLEGHLPGFAAHWFDLNDIPSYAVTLHALKPEALLQWYADSEEKR